MYFNQLILFSSVKLSTSYDSVCPLHERHTTMNNNYSYFRSSEEGESNYKKMNFCDRSKKWLIFIGTVQTQTALIFLKMRQKCITSDKVDENF